MKISQLSHDKVLITLLNDDMKNFELNFDTMGLCDPHSKKIIERLLTLACNNSNLQTNNKVILCEALKNNEGCMLFVSLADKKKNRKKYKIKRITKHPCFKFFCVENMLTAFEKLCDKDLFFYNNSVYLYSGCYYLVFDYPIVSQRVKKVLCEYSEKLSGSKAFIARLSESGKNISSGNAIFHIGSSL